MSWLTIQMWMELLLAALFGGVIGWALQRMRSEQAATSTVSSRTGDREAGERARRIVDLEGQVKALQAESAELRSRLAGVPAAQPAGASGLAAPPVEGEDSLVWKNRYLESRVRFLDGKLKEAESQIDTLQQSSASGTDAREMERLHWRVRYLDGRTRFLEEELQRASAPAGSAAAVVSTSPTAAASPPGVGARPASLLSAPRNGAADDLKEITGIGPKLEKTLHELGVFHFDQIAAWSQAEIDWVNNSMSFRGRIEREKWVEQAAALARGEMTEGQRKYREGKQS